MLCLPYSSAMHSMATLEVLIGSAPDIHRPTRLIVGDLTQRHFGRERLKDAIDKRAHRRHTPPCPSRA
jgi:hypothetical protein